jgi:hypothetical protein
MWDTLLGDGVSEADALLLRTPSSDPSAPPTGISVHVEGIAERQTSQKRFVWSFRRFVQYEDCRLPGADASEIGLSLHAERNLEVEISVTGAALFQEHLEAGPADLRFEPFREADDVYGDADGEITLSELGRTPSTNGSNEGVPSADTLREVLVVERLPRIARFRHTGTCSVKSTAKREDGAGFP